MKHFSIIIMPALAVLVLTSCGGTPNSVEANAPAPTAQAVHTTELICRDGSHPYPNPQPYPTPRDRTACIDNVCDKIGRFSCDTQSEINDVSRLCANDVSSDCLDNVCEKIGRFECDDLGEISRVAQVCSRDLSLPCIDSVCNRIGRFNCDSIGEIQQVANSCK